MATNISRFSSIATDPLRNFKFYVEFSNTTNGPTDIAPTTANAAITTIKGGFLVGDKNGAQGWTGVFVDVKIAISCE